jgi:hypothetical protein
VGVTESKDPVPLNENSLPRSDLQAPRTHRRYLRVRTGSFDYGLRYTQAFAAHDVFAVSARDVRWPHRLKTCAPAFSFHVISEQTIRLSGFGSVLDPCRAFTFSDGEVSRRPFLRTAHITYLVNPT